MRKTRRRRGGDIYAEKKQERSEELGQLGQSGITKQMIEKYKKEKALLHGGRKRRGGSSRRKMTRRNK